VLMASGGLRLKGRHAAMVAAVCRETGRWTNRWNGILTTDRPFETYQNHNLRTRKSHDLTDEENRKGTQARRRFLFGFCPGLHCCQTALLFEAVPFSVAMFCGRPGYQRPALPGWSHLL